MLASPGRDQDVVYLRELIDKYRITIADFVPSMLKVFLDELQGDSCRDLRHVFCGGGVLPVKLQERFCANLNASLHNMYGPTETSIDATCWTCRPSREQQSVPIGRPIDNKRIYLLDSFLQPVPIGVPAELCIGGVGLSRGYLGRPDFTAEKFIPNPFSEEKGARLYKTGDLARYLPDGMLEYLGRLDDQVKVRGFRIELGEIESVLSQHPALGEVAIVSREQAPGDNRLVAYLVAATTVVPTISELRNYVQEKLPDYMVPANFVFLDKLPLTANGKVNRQALPLLEPPQKSETEYVAPRTAQEKLLSDIWARLLGLERIGIRDRLPRRRRLRLRQLADAPESHCRAPRARPGRCGRQLF